MIQQLVNEKDDPTLRDSWKLPSVPTHPFDLLVPFDGFEEYYYKLVRKRIAKAELSRVIVVPSYRGQRLGEVIVDSAVSEARRRGLELLFLACQERHQKYYEQCGFRAISGMWCERFGSFPVAAIAMERWLSDPQFRE